MKILVLGSGGREHALVWKIAQSIHCSELFCAPGNAGTAKLATNVPIAVTDASAITAFAEREKIDLVVIGPDDVLAAGMVDLLTARGIRAFGPSQSAARLESSKSFAKDFMVRHGIPTPRAGYFENSADAISFLEKSIPPIVVKADGLALGKGVIIAQTHHEAAEAVRDMIDRKKFGNAGHRILIEEFLSGGEVSIHAMIDGKYALEFPAAQDHKRALDNDEGLNTGGMGTFSPAPAANGQIAETVRTEILDRFIKGISADQLDFRGMLFPGIILTERGPQVLEFNCRFGDPETQVLLPRLKSDIVELMLASTDGTLQQHHPEWDTRAAVCVIMASGGYPSDYAKGKLISGCDAFDTREDIHIFHAGTRLVNQQLVTSGGRVLGVTALADDLKSARAKAYEAVHAIHFENAHYRTDIACKGISA